MSISKLFNEPIKAVNLGNKGFYDDLRGYGVEAVNLDWKPVAKGDKELIAALDLLSDRAEIDAANKEALDRINAAQPILIGIEPRAADILPGMTGDMLLHAGPPVTWERMAGPMRGAVIGALIFEGRAKTPGEAEALARSGKIKFSPCHEHNAVGPMAGVISPSMPVFVIENKTYKNRAYCTLNEGLGKVLRFGAYGDEVIERLRWMKDILAPGLKKAIELSGGIDLKALIAQALHMGDEVHNRNKAATSLFIRAILPYIVEADLPREEFSAIVTFIDSNDHFFLNLSMHSAKAALDAAEGIKNSAVVTVMARNGTDFGIKVSGLPGQWFTGPAGDINGLLFPGFTEADRNPDMGDSAITETCGLGGFSMAAAFAIVQFVGGAPADAVNYSKKMYEITVGESSAYSIPILDFRGSATGIDIRKVIETGILPQINTGIASKNAGVGQVGAGLVNPPWECFRDAVLAFAKT
ncbi:MAG: DUF1116 domain-containing protein [Defluviitaleaceae bacterium]|nr:DUF1116 domain-containing protein [Defluviitaleaceae bacterium]